MMGQVSTGFAAGLFKVGTFVVEPIHIGAVVGVLLLLVVIKFLRGRGGVVTDGHLTRVRTLVKAGKLREAGFVHKKHGHLVEAFNLFVRGEHHMEASHAAEELGMLDKAASHAEKCRDFERAASLYGKAEDFGMAGKLYKRTGQFRQAAEAMEKDPDSSIDDIAMMWEHACMDLMPEDVTQVIETDAKLIEARALAVKAAEAYKKAGNNDRAALFFDLSQEQEKAEQLRGRSVEKVRDKMTIGPMMAGATAATAPPTLTTSGPTLNGLSTGTSKEELAAMVSDAVKEVIRDQPLVVNQLSVEHLVTDGHGTLAPEKVVYIHDSRDESETPETPNTVGRYLIEDKLGEGGMAVVFKAVDTSLERVVALKFLPGGMTQNDLALRYFEREAKAAARLNHPNIVTIYDCGLMDGRPFISMEYIEGETIEDLLESYEDDGGMPIARVLEIAEGLLAALVAVHEEDLVHRDIKPSNIMLTRHGAIKLMDFGIASGNDAGRNTFVVGTPYYMPPEQFAGQGIDHRSDLFAAGATLYELLTSTRPFRNAERSTLPVAPRRLRAEIPKDLEEIIGRCLLFDIDRRPTSAGEVLEVVQTIRTRLDRVDSAEILPEIGARIPIENLRSTNAPFTSIRDKDLEDIFEEADDVSLPEGPRTPNPSTGQPLNEDIKALLKDYLGD